MRLRVPHRRRAADHPIDAGTVGAYEISDDPARVDLDLVHSFLATSPTGGDVRRGVVETAVQMSLPLSVHLTGAASPTMVGFGRVVTDTATVAWLDDVFGADVHRRRGLAGALVETALAHPAVAGTSMQVLLTMDAHALYARSGFAAFPEPRAFMSGTPASRCSGPDRRPDQRVR